MMNRKNLLKGSIIALLCVALIAGIVLSVARPDQPDDDRLSVGDTVPSVEVPAPTDGPDLDPPLGTGPVNPQGPIIPPTGPSVNQPEQKPTKPEATEPAPTEPGATEPEEPENKVTTLTGDVTVENLTVTEDASFSDGNVSVKIPAGVQLNQNTTSLTLTITEKDSSDSGVQLDAGQTMLPLDVHIEGISAENTAPITVSLGTILPKGLNIGNYSLYHVENGVANKMNAVSTLNNLSAHNDFVYDPTDGNITISVASFSEVVAISEEAVWEGEMDFTWYNPSADTLYIRNADQLAAFGAIVGNMKKDMFGNDIVDANGDPFAQDSFADKTVVLWSDINLGNDEQNNNSDIIFYPIGYWNSDQTYEKTNKAISCGFYTFEGTFDGNGNTIANFYQNTWEMKGTHDWYDASLQYYRQGMGLFGKVYGGTVKNLIVKNFSSDGEITTTGVIAAYADGATFENIAIFNCNPRVYNIGNGGIVGCVGWYAKEADLKTTFKNITVDNSNKISALWGSYDVACGGIVGQYYPTSGQSSAGTPKNAGIHFENCNVAAVMDVYNDVCANYQYYAYRYTGILVGSVRENETIDGRVYPKMDGITAEHCTVTFGDWNDYYYCELVVNSLASYTHDHQMSRLEQVASVNAENKKVTTLTGDVVDIPASGRYNYVVVAKNDDGTFAHATEHATCYHYVDGEKWEHTMAGTETVDGVEGVLKEDKQHIYLEFNNLVTGYGWGVTSKGIGNLDGVTILDKKTVPKFEKVKDGNPSFEVDQTISIKDLFQAIEGVDIDTDNVQVFVSPVGEDSTVSATYEANTTDWTQGTLTFFGIGSAKIVITDYYYCEPTVVYIDVVDKTPVPKFNPLFKSTDFLYRIGNANAVNLSSLFSQADGAEIGNVSVSIEPVEGSNASGAYTPDSTWGNGTIQFSGTGVVEVSITDNDNCEPTKLILEVVDATNATGAANATTNNVVLLNDIGGGFTVSGRYTVYGNGFTLNYTGNGQYLNNGLKQGIITVSENGTLDNLRIKATIYPNAYLYYGYSQLGDYVQGGPSSVEGDKTRYHYQLSAVVAKGNATVQNCYIYGGRTNIFVDTGDVTVKNSILECGVVANMQIQSTSGHTITLEDVTTIQYQVNPTIDDTSKVMLGTAILVGPDTNSNPTIVLNGDFKQYNWVTADDKTAVSDETAQQIIDAALNASSFNHTVNGKTASNLGIIYMNDYEVSVENKTGLPYKEETISISGVNGKAYSLQGATAAQIYSDYQNADRTTVNGDYLPTFDFDLDDQEISYDGSEDTRYLYGDANGVTALYQDGETPLTLDLSKLTTIYKYTGINYTVTAVCKDSSGNELSATNNVVTLSAQGSYTLVFTVNDNIFYNKDGEPITKTVERTFTVPLTLTVKEADVKNAEVNITKTALDGEYTTVNLTDYKLRINFLDCISVTDYDNTGTGTTVSLTSNISSVTLTPSSVNVFTTASTVTITYTDGRVLTVNLSKISGSSPGTKTATVNTSGGVYFITDGALNNKPTEASSQNICTITSVSYKGNNGSTVTNDTDVTVTWALGSSSGSSPCVTADTLVTLADGSVKRIDEITYNDELLVWNFFEGKYDTAPIAIIFDHGASDNTIIELTFSDGTTIKVVNMHQFFDADLNKLVTINSDTVADYVGHKFVKNDRNCNSFVELVSYSITEEYAEAWGIMTATHYNIITAGMLTADFDLKDVDLFNYFEVGENMKFDEAKMQADIEKYGLYTYEDFADYLTYEQFVAFNVQYFKIPVSKGLYTYEGILALIDEYLK